MTFVIATIISSTSPLLFLAPRFWEPLDQLQSGSFSKQEREPGTEVGGTSRVRWIFRAEKRNEHAQNVSTHNLERTGNLSSKVASCGYNLVVSKFSRRIPHSKTDFNDIDFLALYWKCACVGPIFFEMHSQNVLI